ncbi:MAG: hypothetical protein ABII39_02520 [Candidatus Micrarchaeota archaeon]
MWKGRQSILHSKLDNFNLAVAKPLSNTALPMLETILLADRKGAILLPNNLFDKLRAQGKTNDGKKYWTGTLTAHSKLTCGVFDSDELSSEHNSTIVFGIPPNFIGKAGIITVNRGDFTVVLYEGTYYILPRGSTHQPYTRNPYTRNPYTYDPNPYQLIPMNAIGDTKCLMVHAASGIPMNPRFLDWLGDTIGSKKLTLQYASSVSLVLRENDEIVIGAKKSQLADAFIYPAANETNFEDVIPKWLEQGIGRNLKVIIQELCGFSETLKIAIDEIIRRTELHGSPFRD